MCMLIQIEKVANIFCRERLVKRARGKWKQIDNFYCLTLNDLYNSYFYMRVCKKNLYLISGCSAAW